MSDEYTPTTAEVRAGYATDPEAEYHDPLTNHRKINERAFDRWLAAHDAEVREECAQLAEQRWNRLGGGIAVAIRLAGGWK